MDKKNKNSNVPNLRFNGYTENWQKYRTIELGQNAKRKNLNTALVMMKNYMEITHLSMIINFPVIVSD